MGRIADLMKLTKVVGSADGNATSSYLRENRVSHAIFLICGSP